MSFIGIRLAAYSIAPIAGKGFEEHRGLIEVVAHPTLGLETFPAVHDPIIVLGIVFHIDYWCCRLVECLAALQLNAQQTTDY